MIQFPISTGPKEDHPQRVAKLVGVDPKYYYKADELKLYEDAINELANRTVATTSASNELIEKGFHHIINFDWYVFAQKYKWNGVLYEQPEDLVIDTVTIDPAPTTVNFKRFDVIVFNDDFTFSKVVGDEGLNPAIPKIDIRTQMQLTVILVEYGTTEPSYLTKQLMYDEGLGLPAEFAVTKTGASITIGNLEQPSSGTKCIKVVNPVNSDVLFLDKQATFNSLDVDTITFKVKNATAGNWRFYLYSYNSIEGFYQGTTTIKNGSYGYSSQNITDHQTIIVPISKILGTSEIHNTGFALTFFNNAGGTFFFDEFALNGNFTQAPINSGISEAPVDNGYYVRRNAGWFSITTWIDLWNAAVTKLLSIEDNATADQTGAEIKALYEAEANTNAYTDSEKAKLGSIDATHYLPPLQTTVQLSALAQASLTDKARVYVEDELSDYFYDASAVSGSIAPNDQVGGIGFWRIVAIGGETAASIKTKYESNADTNAFTDALLAKLNSITEIFTTGLKANYDAAYNWVTTNGANVLAHIANKQNSLATDGTGVKYPTVDAVNAGLATKLNTADYNQHFKGKYLTAAAMRAAHPTASVGDSAQVNEVGATTVVNYSWDDELGDWVETGSVSGGATNTDELPEGTVNLYFNTARVLATVLTGISFLTGTAVVATDTVLVAFGKLQKQISDLTTAVGLNTAKVTNATHTGEVIGSGALTIESGVVDRDNLHVSLKTRITNATVTGTYTLDHSLGSDWKLTLTGITTIAESNLPTGTDTIEFTMKVTGNFGLTVPAYWNVLGDTYDGTKWNFFAVQIHKGDATQEATCFISNF